MLLAVLVALVGGIALGGHPAVLPDPVRDTLVGDSRGQVFEQVLDKIDADYYKKPSEDKLLDVALTAVVDSLDDRFSHYLTPRLKDANDLTRVERFEGVGLMVDEIPAGLAIVTVYEGGPAARAGLRPGDQIVGVGGMSLKGKRSAESTARIKGKAGTEVRLTLRRKGRTFKRTMQREAVSVPITSSRIVDHEGERYGYVKLDQFRAGAGRAVSTRTRKLLKAGVEGIVLDLRGNGGGLLDEGVNVASVFLQDGVVVSTKGRNRPERRFEAEGDAIAKDVPVVVLVDGGTASASEIVTGALQDRGRATVVGTRTFGKGVFQEVESLPNGGALDITVGEYFTPKGRNLGPRDGKPGGITPEIKAVDKPATPKDEGLDAALTALAGKAP